MVSDCETIVKHNKINTTDNKYLKQPTRNIADLSKSNNSVSYKYIKMNYPLMVTVSKQLINS